MPQMTTDTTAPILSDLLLSWYDRSGRTLPWRLKTDPNGPMQLPDPYHVWLSEIMLQQTTVVAVKPYFLKFLETWPTVSDLSAAPVEDVMQAWAGLGYYARARNLHKCAQVVADELNGVFPSTQEGLLQLPGIGPYTAAAIASIAFGQHAVVVDGNVERVMARMFAVTDPLPPSKPQLVALAAQCTPQKRAGDYAQAVMDLGATICTPKNPACGICPWQNWCEGRKLGIHTDLPAKLEKAPKPTRRGMIFWITRKDGSVLIRRRAPSGLLGGMMEFPSTPWDTDASDAAWTLDAGLEYVPLAIGTPKQLPGVVRHTFTHFHLELIVIAAQARTEAVRGIWVKLDALGDQALPSLMNKVMRHALKKAY